MQLLGSAYSGFGSLQVLQCGGDRISGAFVVSFRHFKLGGGNVSIGADDSFRRIPYSARLMVAIGLGNLVRLLNELFSLGASLLRLGGIRFQRFGVSRARSEQPGGDHRQGDVNAGKKELRDVVHREGLADVAGEPGLDQSRNGNSWRLRRARGIQASIDSVALTLEFAKFHLQGVLVLPQQSHFGIGFAEFLDLGQHGGILLLGSSLGFDGE